MRRLTDRRVVHVQVTADRADHDLAGVEPDADLHRHAVRASRLLGVPSDVPADLPDAILNGARAEAYGRAKNIQIPIAPNPIPAMTRSGRGAEGTAGEPGEGGGQTQRRRRRHEHAELADPRVRSEEQRGELRRVPQLGEEHAHEDCNVGDRKSTRLNSSHGYISY